MDDDQPVVDLAIEGLENAVVIGSGGFATVYRADQPAFRRTVAIKVLAAGHLDERAKARFERECQAMGALSGHPGIVTVFDGGFDRLGRAYLVMEYMPDGSLDDQVKHSGALGWEESTRVGVKMAGALATAHDAGVIHRDMKPANILMSPYREPQLADFGIARIAGGPETRSGVVTASLAHAAPEVIDGDPPSVASDVYALGSTIFHLAAGVAAFAKDTDESVIPLLMRIQSDPVPDMRPLGTPDAVCDVIERSMAKDPGSRQASAAEFGADLQDAQRSSGLEPTEMLIGLGSEARSTIGHDRATVEPTTEDEDTRPAGATRRLPTEAPPPPPDDPTGPVPPERRRSRRGLFIVGASVAAAVVALVVILMTSRDGDDELTQAAVPTTSGNVVETTATPTTSAPVVGTTVPPATSPTSTEPPVVTEWRVGTAITLEGEPVAVAVAGDAIWVSSYESGDVSRIDPDTNEVVASVPLDGETADGLAIDEERGRLWVVNRETADVWAIDMATNAVIDRVPVEGAQPSKVAVGEGGVWVVNEGSDTLSLIDPDSAAVTLIPVGALPVEVLVAEGYVWVSNHDSATVSRIDPSTLVRIDIPVGNGPLGLAAGFDSVWVAVTFDGAVARIDPLDVEVTAMIGVGGEPDGIAAGAGAVWVTNRVDDTVIRIDPVAEMQTATIVVGERPDGVAVGHGAVWVANYSGQSVTRLEPALP